MKLKHTLAVLGLTAGGALASDLAFPPVSSAGHDLNHSAIGQSFTAAATDVQAGIYLTDGASFTNWLSNVYPGQIAPGSYPYAIAPSVTVRLDLLDGEGAGGTVICSDTLTLTAPFEGFVNLDAGAAGVALTPGHQYTILMTDVSGQTYPQGVTGWTVPAFSGYDGGHPVLQGQVVTDETNIGDNCFQVLDNIVSGHDAVITAYVARNPGFIVVNGGLNLYDHLWTTNLNPTNTTFMDGLVNWYQTGLLVDYTGIRSSQGVILTGLVVKKQIPQLAFSASALISGTQGVAYSCPLTLTVSGGAAPFTVSVSGLPAGLGFDGTAVSGVPSASGSFAPAVSVTDARGTVVTQTLSLTINPPPPPAAYTVREESKGRITAVGSDYLLVGTKKLFWNASTQISVHTATGELHTITSFIKPGMKVEWKGLRDPATNNVLTSKLSVN